MKLSQPVSSAARSIGVCGNNSPTMQTDRTLRLLTASEPKKWMQPRAAVPRYLWPREYVAYDIEVYKVH